jgi:addiction module HigA family antidote
VTEPASTASESTISIEYVSSGPIGALFAWRLWIIIKLEQFMQHIIAVHPGAVLKDELDERGLSQSAIAQHIGVLPRTINEICRGKRGISAEMAVKLSMSLGASAQFWLNLQTNWELSQVKRKHLKRIRRIAA